MKYYSEITEKMYDTAEELAEAEKQAQAISDKCKTAYDDYKQAVKGYNDAYVQAHEILNNARKIMLEKEKAYDEIRKSNGNKVKVDEETVGNMLTLLKYILDV